MQVSGTLLLLGLLALLHAARNVKSRQQSRPKGRRLRLEIDPSVWPELSSMTAPSLANRSLSPWTYTGSSEESRFPRWIYSAQCLTASCLSLRGEGEDAALEAAPIYYPTLVLHRVPKQRKANKKKGRSSREKYEFQLRTAVVSVGCTCVRPTVIPQQ
ncbi:interleukin 17a/f3 isoform X2 [Takifugu rubripes]|uniref:interleukin 17a/f3 isoform X2 n=1 Tax=Takifugu rubripes TaxID=31033 RepID=UPI001145C82F|nr:interleukin-17F-like isoform X2 [Takifugu rubripes]